MSREFEMFLQMHEPQPPPLPLMQNHFSMPSMPAMPMQQCEGARAAPPTGYELTVGAAGSAGGSSCGGLSPRPPSMQDARKKKLHFGSVTGDDTGSETSRAATAATYNRKRKSSFGGSTYDDDGEDSRSTRNPPDKKQNHSEIEKRRRDKMNTYITELGNMVPMCRALARKLDKLTVLRMAVQHLRQVRGALSAGPLTARPRPAVLSERELNALVVRAAKHCFLLVVGCDRGRLLYVSASVHRMLHYHQSELVGQSLFDLLHPKDVAKVKEQLSSSDLSPRERLIDAKTMLPVKADVVFGASRLCPGARRSFFCRVKCRSRAVTPPSATVTSATVNQPPKVKDEHDAPRKKMDKKYCVVQCTGYLKSWTAGELTGGGGGGGAGGSEECAGGSSGGGGDGGEEGEVSCLVAVARALPDLAPPSPCVPPPPAPAARPLQYISRHASDGKFLFVDQRVTLALGFVPQELVGTSVYEYVGAGQAHALAAAIRAAMARRNCDVQAPPYAFRRRDGTYVTVQTRFKHFLNPWTKELECLVANNTLISDEVSPADLLDQHYNFYKHVGMDGMEGLETIGEGIPEGVMLEEERLSQPPGMLYQPPDLCPSPLLLDDMLTHQATLMDSLVACSPDYSQVRNNVSLSEAGGGASPPLQPTPPPSGPTDGNGEAAMAVIMNLLEADAGLGGPVNLAGLPWLVP